MRWENIIFYNTFVNDRFVLLIWPPGWRNDEDRWLGRGWQNEVFRVLQTDGASSAGHREKVSKRGDNVIGAEIINMVELDNHDPKNQKVWFFKLEKVAAPPTVLPRPTTKDLWSRVGLFCILHPPPFVWYHTIHITKILSHQARLTISPLSSLTLAAVQPSMAESWECSRWNF